jgi:hypothetical protein
MALISSTGLILLFGFVAAYLINKFVNSKNHEHPLPPGPKGLPLLGNVNDLPKPGGGLEAHHWLKHKDEYGPISSITVLGQTFIIINDAQIALELLRDRAQHSARPHMVFSSDMYVECPFIAGIAYNGTSLTSIQDRMEEHLGFQWLH